jgi:acetyl coenzyme A synthetase (ADP forming)-like protein
MGIHEELKTLFEPKSVAVIGAAREPHKIGHVILKNFVENFKGDVYPVNPNADEILNRKCYPDINKIPWAVDLAVISVPAEIVPAVMEQCAKKKVKSAIIISGGFGEVGRKDLEEKTLAVARKAGIRFVGPNCLGIYDSRSQVDTLFLPRYRLQRPREGSISFVSQSGAVGSAVLDWAASEGFGVSKFISYGNATDLDEVDLLEYLAEDRKTKVICVYLEGTRRGRLLMDAAKKITQKKPIIIIKGGRTEAGAKAVGSHTGLLAGSDMVYSAAFKQAGMIRANGVMAMFDYARVLAEQPPAKGPRMQIITNGGGFGVLATDEIIKEGLQLAQMSDETKKKIAAGVPKYAVVSNPLDLVGDADSARYALALEAIADDKNVDGVLCIVLFQTAGVESEIIDVITEFSDRRQKPIVVCSAGGDYTKVHIRMLEKAGVPTFDTPTRAAHALWCLVRYGHILKEG